ncbi:MAG: hypothetical protein ACJAW8_000071 [Oleispira sp.]|jgi:hypothetical protein|tara:strand:+ start:1437 stop:2447 length:1011 start_codon:yes stop_codon:yes gene_type:complete
MYFSIRSAIAALLLVTLTGCSSIYRTTGWFAYDFAEDYAMPYVMKTDDTEMGCAMSESMTPMLLSFSELTWYPDRLATSMYMQAGACAEAQASEEGLTYLRAYKAQNIGEAKDARIRQKRLFSLAANRQYKAYKHLVAEFGEPGEECPDLDEDEEFFWMLGLVSGMQAVMSDVRGQGEVGVPKDIAMKSVRGSQCIDAKRWWGVPKAMQAAVWTMMPDNAPDGVDPWQELADASELAGESGVRLAQAVEVVIADGSGNEERLRDAIRRHAQSVKTTPSNKNYRMLDIVATQQVLAVSDRLWTEATGSRTPIGGLGTFWDDASPAEEALDINDLLED